MSRESNRAVGHRAAVAVLALAILAGLLCVSERPAGHGPVRGQGPLALLLSSSTDLGASEAPHVQLTAALRSADRPARLMSWARERGLSVRWRPGESWAFVEGTADNMAAAFEVAVHDYHATDGQRFYAATTRPELPRQLGSEVTDLGTVLGYNPVHPLRPPVIGRDVPNKALTPQALVNTYNVTPLASTGRGQTIVFIEIDGYQQADLDSYSDRFGLPRFTPTLIGGLPGPVEGETEMDLEVAHAIAPDANLVVVNLFAFTGRENFTFEQVARAFDAIDRQFPGAVWSISLGIGCDRMVTAADLAPVQAALEAAEAHGTSAYMSSGDSGGYECKGGDRFSTPPTPDEIGLNAVGSVPAMTSVGGTTLSTDVRGAWISEQGWVSSPTSLGTGGGVSSVFDRPAWQSAVSIYEDATHRVIPDVAAVADSNTGVLVNIDGEWRPGGGTSQSAPIWAAITAVMNEYLIARGGHAIGDANPLLYRVATSGRRTAFHDVQIGGNAVYDNNIGYDLVTGLGTPNTMELVNEILDIQRAGQ